MSVVYTNKCVRVGTDDLLINVIEALADSDGIEETEMDYNFAEYMDPEVIERLNELEDGFWELTFRVSDHQVTITHMGLIFIDGVKYIGDTALYE